MEKMKTVLFLILVFLSGNLISQSIEISDFNSVIIDPTGNGNIGIMCYDVDNDGDKDIISVSPDERELNWFRNDLDSISGNFSFQKINISNNIDGQYIDVEDINDDGIPEVLCSEPSLGRIALFYGNSIADSIYWNDEIVANDFNGAHQVHLVDMDGDGDYDILAAANIESKIKWWEFNSADWYSHLIEANYEGVQSVVSHDFNNDGYQDIVSGTMSQATGLVNIWYSGYADSLVYIKDTLETQLYGSHWFEIEDVNKDGLMDIVLASYFSNKIVAWERTHPDSLSFSLKTLVQNIEYPLHIALADMDNDDDMDLLVPELSGNNHKLLCYENIDGVYTRNVIKTYFNAAWQILPFDVDNDQDMDFVAGGFYFPNPDISAKLTLFVNELLTTSIDSKYRNSIGENICYTYPNPFSYETTISFTMQESSDVFIEIYNESGQLIISQAKGFLNKGTHSFLWYGKDYNGNKVSGGIYYLKIIYGSHSLGGKIIFSNHR